jgi:hypothetical protein
MITHPPDSSAMRSMNWACTHCGTRHDSEEEIRDCYRARRAAKRLAILILMVIVVVLLGGALVVNQIIYSDWRCAFVKCRIIEVKEKGSQ